MLYISGLNLKYNNPSKVNDRLMELWEDILCSFNEENEDSKAVHAVALRKIKNRLLEDGTNRAPMGFCNAYEEKINSLSYATAQDALSSIAGSLNKAIKEDLPTARMVKTRPRRNHGGDDNRVTAPSL
jgi:hypothetical protein